MTKNLERKDRTNRHPHIQDQLWKFLRNLKNPFISQINITKTSGKIVPTCLLNNLNYENKHKVFIIVCSILFKVHVCLPDMHCMVPQILKTSEVLKMKIMNTLVGLLGFASGIHP